MISKPIGKTTVLILLNVFWFGMWVLPAWADQIEFGDGNVLQGTVTRLEKGTLTFSTEYAEKIQIPVEKIQTLFTDKAVKIKMVNDSILTGKLTTLEDGQIAVILEPVGETVPFQWDQVKNINEPPERWDGHFSLGGNIQTGNVDRASVSFSFDTRRNWQHDRFQFRILHNYAEKDGSITARNTFGAMKFDHFFTDVFFNALSLEVLKDEFKDLNLRSIVGLGLGYRVLKEDRITLELEAGVTYFSEDLDQGQDDQFISGRGGLTLSVQILENLLFKDYLLYYPSFDEPKEYRLRNEAFLISTLGKGWALKLTHIFDQNSTPSPGIDDKDQQFIFSIQYAF